MGKLCNNCTGFIACVCFVPQSTLWERDRVFLGGLKDVFVIFLHKVGKYFPVFRFKIKRIVSISLISYIVAIQQHFNSPLSARPAYRWGEVGVYQLLGQPVAIWSTAEKLQLGGD
jgi:hypothetical protein